MRWKSRIVGFSLLELMIVVAIIGILARLAIPRYRAFTAEARRAEAKVNLRSIHTYQEAYMVAHNVYWSATAGTLSNSTKYGYKDNTDWECAAPGISSVVIAGGSGKKLGFKFRSDKECREMRYGYQVNGNEGDYVALAHGGHNKQNWIYEQCSGTGAAVAVGVANCGTVPAATGGAAGALSGHANGDSICIGSEKPLQVIKDIIDDCK